jgi:ABC-2 type transport system ATP-binding protein
LWNYVVELNRKGVTIVLTTHYLEEAQELCDQIAIINRGQVVACEPTPTLLRRMDTRHVLVTPAEPVTTAPSLPGFETRLIKQGGFSVSYRTGHSSVEQVLAAIRAAGLHIKDISTEDADLEDVFVALTSEAPPEAA